MSITALSGPLVVGFTELMGGVASPGINPEAGPSLLAGQGLQTLALSLATSLGRHLGT